MPNTSKAVAARPRTDIDESSYSGKVAARCRELRDKKGISVQDLVEAVTANGYKLNADRYYVWERRRTKIDPDAYPMLADAFGLKLKTFLPDA